MKTKISSMLDITKKKIGIVLLSGALVATIGVGTAFATDSISSTEPAISKLLCKVHNGIRSFSTDDGKTWSDKAPEGVTVSDKDGKTTISNGIPPKDGEGKGLLCRVENGVKSYSTDGGKTWSDKAPDGVTIGADGAMTFKGKDAEK
jgi:hypothetical protein